MVNKSLLRDKLKSDVIEIRRKTESSGDNLPIELGFPKILSEVEEALNNNTPDKKQLEKNVYGIFRLVSESYKFEKSPLGQELLNLRSRIRDFISTLPLSK